MPSSRPNIIPTVIHVLRQLRPRSILDVGVGFGKWGHLFREYTDILEAEHDPARYLRKNWQVRIDGIEGHAAYLTPMHRFLYNRIHRGDAARLLPRLPCYDLVFLGDIIEHFEKHTGLQLLRDALDRAGQAVIVSTPKFQTDQEGLCANELERHRSLWTAKDFKRFPAASVKTVDGATLLAVLPKPGAPPLELTPPRAPRGEEARRLLATRKEIAELAGLDEKFVLVDDEQIRGSLQHRQALPFLEKQGRYWGPPPDDATAIQELERLRRQGARAVVFVWSAFWWLEHYRQFARHLRKTYPCLRDNEYAVAFSLAPRRRRTRG
jgi:SAM-dependent methyltransferase